MTNIHSTNNKHVADSESDSASESARTAEYLQSKNKLFINSSPFVHYHLLAARVSKRLRRNASLSVPVLMFYSCCAFASPDFVASTLSVVFHLNRIIHCNVCHQTSASVMTVVRSSLGKAFEPGRLFSVKAGVVP